MRREMTQAKAERLIKKRLARDVSEAILDNTRMLNLLDMGFGPDNFNLNRRTRKR